MELFSGERFFLDDEKNFLKIISGKVEVYVVSGDEKNFRQIFIMYRQSGEFIFPALDDVKAVKIMIYAVEDSVIENFSSTQLDADELKSSMTDWFENLISLQWLRLIADRGDEVLKTWIKKNIFDECGDDKKKILDTFTHNEQIFSMFAEVRFISEEKNFDKRIEIRERQKRRLVEDSISTLLNEDKIFFEETESNDRLQKNEETIFIVKCVAAAMKMPPADLNLNPNIVKKLDAVEIIRRLIQKQNMQMRFVTLTKGWYKKDSGVLIGYYGEKKNLAAIIPTAPDKYKIVTKNFPEGVAVDEEIAKQIDKAAFVCYAGLPARKLKIIDLINFIFRQSKKEDFYTIIFASLFAGIVPLATPIITEIIFRDILPILDRKDLVTVTQIMMVTSFTLAAMSTIRSATLIRISTRLDMSIEAALWSRLLTLPEKFFRKFQSGELADRMRGIKSIKNFIDGNFIPAIFDTIFSFWTLFLMCYYSLPLTAAAIFIWLIWFIVTALIYRRVIFLNKKIIDSGNKESGLIQQIFSGLAKFRLRGAEEQAYNLWSKVFGETWQWNLKLRRQNNYTAIISSVQPFILTMVLYYFAIYETQPTISNGKIIQVGMGYAQFLAFTAAYSAFNSTLNSLIPSANQFFKIRPYIENLRPLLDEEPEITSEKIDAEVLTGKIKVSDLTFSYGEKLPDVLKNVSFEVAAGENIAIVGKSGCGKSTLVRLLLGFEKPKKGAIYFDGQDLSLLNLSSIRSQMGVVLQNGQLMTGDIFTNIIGTANLTQKDAWRAAESAGIADDIKKMPMGMQTIIGEGSSNISGGQRQRILIARALAAKPAILIFDEATSALDNKSQAIVTKSIENLNVTRIIIAHRLSTIKSCDRIIVMDDGKIVEVGSFDELKNSDGIFSTLVKRQTF